jgi:hypothetical protein
MGEFIQSLANGEIGTAKFTEKMNTLANTADGLTNKFQELIPKIGKDIVENIGSRYPIERVMKDWLGSPVNKTGTNATTETNSNQKVTFDPLVVKVEGANGMAVTKEQQDATFNSTQFKQYIQSLIMASDPNNKKPMNPVYSS